MTSSVADRAAAEEATPEHILALRVLSAFVREDVVGLRSAGRIAVEPDGTWLRLPTRDGTALRVPVEPDGFQAVWRARLPVVVAEGPPVRRLEALDDMLAAFAAEADPRDRPGFAAYVEECRQTVATMALHADTRQKLGDLLLDRHGVDPARWTGLAGSLGFDALAARHDHPVYPTARGRSGLTTEGLRAFAPEFAQPFALRWLVLPRAAVRLASDCRVLPGLPGPAELGCPGDAVALPVHPLTVGPVLDTALAEAGLEEVARLAPVPAVDVVPTLSMRTVALVDLPAHHVKVPLATATLGQRNRRTIKPGTLVDGVAGQRLVQAVLDRRPALAGRVLVADETAYAHAGHDLLATMVRRYPDGLDDAVVVPLAALTAEAPGGRLVVEHLADRFAAGDPARFLDRLFEVLFDVHVTLFRHGIALESHQQNLSLVLRDGRPFGLLLKDNDAPRVNRARLRELGLDRWPFDDRRTYADDAALADVFTTITVHLCAGAFAFALADRGLVPLADSLDLVRSHLAGALEAPGTACLRSRLLEAPELPVKAMVTAGTLLGKDRSRAADVNKHYTTGPNYLRPGTEAGPR